MPFRRQRRRRMMLAPIVSFRQIFDKAITFAGGVTDNTEIVTVDDTTDVGALNTNCHTGSKIYRIRVNITARGAAGSDSGDLSWYLAKARDGQASGTFPSPNAIGGDMKRNQIFITEFDTFSSQDAPGYKYDRWIKIPKIYQRMRTGDIFLIKFRAEGTSNIEVHYHADYKIYT